VLDGLFTLARRLFGLHLREVAVGNLWHETARFFQIDDASGKPVGGLLIDLYARPNKRGGAWMDGCRDRACLPTLRQDPIAYLVCNFPPPGADEPSYLSHYDVQTLFHEFGHALHHLLTEIDYPSIAGINGVAWDAVELPSQFLENYAWLPDVLTEISAHKDTGEPIPATMIETLIATRSFLGGLAMVRQLEFALFDFRLHTEAQPPSSARVQEILDQSRAQVSVIPVPDYNRFQCSFAHVFAGGYAAGYYSYKWAEVLAADAFSAFDAAGPFDPATARRFRTSVLAVGGSQPAMQAFMNFRGRAPELEPLLRQTGIA
jgi:oligopeptidase A